MPAGQVTVDVRHSGYAPRSLEVTDPSRPQIVELQSGVAWKGKVRLPDGTTLDACRIQLEVKSEPIASSSCSPDGFSLEHLPVGAAQILVAPGQNSPLGARTLRQSVQISAAGSQADIAWPAGVKVEGLIVGGDGQPVPGALLVAVAKERTASQGDVRVMADARGHFSLRDLPRGVWRLTADLHSPHRATVEVDAQTDQLGLRVTAGPPKEQ